MSPRKKKNLAMHMPLYTALRRRPGDGTGGNDRGTGRDGDDTGRNGTGGNDRGTGRDGDDKDDATVRGMTTGVARKTF